VEQSRLELCVIRLAITSLPGQRPVFAPTGLMEIVASYLFFLHETDLILSHTVIDPEVSL
jgi:hypothetical protein